MTNLPRIVREYPVTFSWVLSRPLFIAMGLAFTDVVYQRMESGQLDVKSMLAAGGMAALYAGVRLTQIWFKTKDPAQTPAHV